MLLLIRCLTAGPSRLAALALRRPHVRAATTKSTTPAVPPSRLAGSPPAEDPAADQGCESEPLDRGWGSTLSRADPAEVAGILRRLHDEHIHLGLGTFNLLLKQACEAEDLAFFVKGHRGFR
ncbi:hypothetical protein ACQ4PT_022933 [Festuca glaucescens]